MFFSYDHCVLRLVMYRSYKYSEDSDKPERGVLLLSWSLFPVSSMYHNRLQSENILDLSH